MKEKIIIKKISETYIQVFCEDTGVYFELESFYKFRPKGYQFSPKFKAKVWDGYIKPFSPAKRLLYSGLLQSLIDFCKEREYDLELDKSTYTPSNLKYDKDDLEKFIASVPLTAGGKEITPNEHQLNAIHSVFKSKRNIFLLPTSSGKSLVLYLCSRYLLDNEKQILIVVPTVSLVNQMQSDFIDYASTDDFSVAENTHLIFSGQDKAVRKPIVITTYQSIAANKNGDKVPQSWFNRFDAIFVDEAHTAEAASVLHILENCVNAEYRIGVTGSLDEGKTNPIVLTGLLGPVKRITTTKKLQELGIVTKLKINGILLKYGDESKALVKTLDYDKEMKFLNIHKRRNAFIRNLAVGCTGTTLVLCRFIDDHLLPLAEMIRNKVGEDRKVIVIYGDIDKDERERLRKEIDSYKDPIIVATYKTMGTGINIRSIENVIFAHPIKSMETVLQSIGRSLRLYDGKEYANIFDIGDDLRLKKKKNFSFSHFIERLEVYDSEEFTYKITEVNIE